MSSLAIAIQEASRERLCKLSKPRDPAGQCRMAYATRVDEIVPMLRHGKEKVSTRCRLCGAVEGIPSALVSSSWYRYVCMRELLHPFQTGTEH